ncbi:MAG: hypothetical protein ACOC58_04525 [Chloroflexota bacterium]
MNMNRALDTTEARHAEPEAAHHALLAVLEHAAAEPNFLADLAHDPHEALREYYTLTAEERAALASGDIRTIEAWVGKLDKELATWLWSRLCQERW